MADSLEAPSGRGAAGRTWKNGAVMTEHRDPDTPTAPDPADVPPSEGDDLAARGDSRSQRPSSAAFRAFITEDWDDTQSPVARREVADHTPARRDALVRELGGTRMVLPAGVFHVRSNDTDFAFRPHTAFAYYGGFEREEEPDSVLVVEPSREDPSRSEAVYYFQPRAGRDTTQFYGDSRYGELWVGRRPTLEEMEEALGIPCRRIEHLGDDLVKDLGPDLDLAVVAGVDPGVDDLVRRARDQAGLDTGEPAERANVHLAETVSAQRLVKDAWEIERMREAVAATHRGFDRVIASLPGAVAHRRGERIIQGAFDAHARAEGNGVGYDTIAAAGAHAGTLHWTRNDGRVLDTDLVLVDAGVEIDELYTADITRTFPVSGTFSPVQRRVYQAVLDVSDEVFAVARPGIRFRELHETAMTHIARILDEWGLLPVGAEESLDPEGQYHRRWMVHGVSHHLGLDVHDCAQARREMYLDSELVPGMVFTIEPGLYFQETDLKVPAELRGLSVRIEDDVLVTEDGVENLSAAIPRTVEGVEAWMARILGGDGRAGESA
jgi:Xaa-Pro aminopeptidase